MSRSAKLFLASSFAIAGTTVWGVHWLQKWESDNMYQGVVKDEARVAAKAAASAAASLLPAALTPASLATPTTSHSSSTPLNTPSSPVQQPLTPTPPKPVGGVGVAQPAAVIDEDCLTCQISPPPQLLEAQSAEERKAERQARAKEYEEQKALGGRLAREQNVERRLV
ncbi:hypothetical protein CI109_100132 [Kwoniella shandongensis]|uniref:Uncharacterized protein n=1 Tax=Kwoniella shandongensis TaxID=1734106 RepID=A0A5M6BPZ7_9TREE|nr:uncharacterized protein CI109_006840 [Kwoniella shandongensis]KAA5524817.1 hypothetical protein CI109_006840 [Kwoniella shandongensis]